MSTGDQKPHHSSQLKIDPASLADNEHHEYVFKDRIAKPQLLRQGDVPQSSYGSRHLPKSQDTWMNYFFGAEKVVHTAREKLHPCVIVSNEFHQCMDRSEDRYDFCRSKGNMLEACFRQYHW